MCMTKSSQAGFIQLPSRVVPNCLKFKGFLPRWARSFGWDKLRLIFGSDRRLVTSSCEQFYKSQALSLLIMLIYLFASTVTKRPLEGINMKEVVPRWSPFYFSRCPEWTLSQGFSLLDQRVPKPVSLTISVVSYLCCQSSRCIRSGCSESLNSV